MQHLSSFMNEYKKIAGEFDEIKYVKAHMEEVEHLREKDIVLCGAGFFGKRCLVWLNRFGISPVCFTDKIFFGSQINSFDVLTLAEAVSKYPNAQYLICSQANARSIEDDLMTCVPKSQIQLAGTLNIPQMDTATFESDYLKGYKWAYSFFEDYISKKVILDRIKAMLFAFPLNASDGEQYFDNSVVHLSGEEVFVDGGMYTGDTATQFLKVTNGKYKHYYGFEIDKTNFETAKKNLTNMENATLEQRGLWSKNNKLRYSENLNDSSKLFHSGEGVVECVTLDSYFAELSIKPTLIKLDIEGAEKEALIGMKNLMSTAKPKLSVCVYHKPEDIYELAEIINTYSYKKIYLRHYSNGLYDTVLYAF